MTSAVIPWGDKLHLFGRDILLQATDINVAVLYVFAVVSVGVYGIMIGGWASNNKFSLIGAIRAASQMISYEVAMGLSIIALLMMTGTLSLREISAQQEGMNWNVFYQPLSFLIFLICAFAETNRTPFDLAECETELIGGYHTEYSSMKMGFYLFAEYANMFISSTILAVLFFGGYNYPGMSWAVENWGVNIANVLGIVALFIKICGFIFFYMWVRWTIPRFRYDQLMHLGWRILIPLSIVNIMITGIVILRHEIIAYLGF
jgi:NADH-quinone oxidoreductase subunit H